MTWVDFDNDGSLDIFVANDSVPNYLWRNDGNGQFEEIAFEAGCAVSADGRAQSSMGMAVADYDNNGWIDLLVTNFSEDYNTLYNNSTGVLMQWSATNTNMVLANNAIYSPSSTALDTSTSFGVFMANYVTGGSDRPLDGVALCSRISGMPGTGATGRLSRMKRSRFVMLMPRC